MNIASLDASAGLLAGDSLMVNGGALQVEASTTANDSALADGTAVNTATGVAGAVAINRSTPTAEATISGSASATSVAVTANVNGDTNVASNSGQGSTTVGVAGALGLDLPGANAHAAIAAGGSVVASGTTSGAVTVQATTVTQDTATANGKALGFAGTGVGASVALEFADNGATAEASGTVTAPGDVSVIASGNYTEADTADSGAAGGTATAPALALAVASNTTMALIGSAALIAAAGQLVVQALHDDESTSTAQGESAGASLAVGPALAVNIALDTDAATIAGNVTESASATVESDLGDSGTAVSEASAKGAASGGGGINNVIGEAVSFGMSSGWLPSQVHVPSATTASGSLAIAAAAAVNVDLAGQTATIAAGGSVMTSSPLLVHTVGAVNDSAVANGSPADGSAVGVGAALAINVGRPAIEASISGAATAPEITVKTEMAANRTNAFTATATSGAGETSTGVAGAGDQRRCEPELGGDRLSALLSIGGGTLLVNSVDVTTDVALAVAGALNTVQGFGASVATNAAPQRKPRIPGRRHDHGRERDHNRRRRYTQRDHS